MSKSKNIFKSCAPCHASSNTFRKLITVRSTKSYKRCLKHLREMGINPFKTVPHSRIIGCHFNKAASVQSLLNNPLIKLVEKDMKIRAHGIPKQKRAFRSPSLPLLTPATTPALVTWNIRRIQAPEAWKMTRGKSINVAVLDTGIANHPDLRISGGVNTIDGGSFADDNGHGTHVAGIIAAIGKNGNVIGTAPEVNLYAVKALNGDGEGYVSDIIEGIYWCIDNHMNVINMSFGVLGSDSSATLHQAIKKAVKRGIVIVASAGNSGNSAGQIDEPASFTETIAVAASTKANKIASFSSRGKGISITAPGENILSTWLNGSYKKLSGTSMASPHVAGGAALLLACRSGTRPQLVKKKLKCRSIKLRGFSTLAQGSGLMQLEHLFESNQA
ncbi:S8 family peptidase [Paenibacillus sinopodophylli]|uniref:S8 family peptidase n=1 Tax=Paenibacillus sinopodophylli TaxID=1837342 RepID=UPI00110CC6B4|nr:S8 family peptidase [Paenibacillus sinopodophylli]